MPKVIASPSAAAPMLTCGGIVPGWHRPDMLPWPVLGAVDGQTPTTSAVRRVTVIAASCAGIAERRTPATTVRVTVAATVMTNSARDGLLWGFAVRARPQAWAVPGGMPEAPRGVLLNFRNGLGLAPWGCCSPGPPVVRAPEEPEIQVSEPVPRDADPLKEGSASETTTPQVRKHIIGHRMR